jgi:hypothetical protein
MTGQTRRCLWRPTLLVAGALGSAVCLLVAGCGGQQHALVPVSGRVVLDGKGLANAEVTFEPAAEGTDPLHPPPNSFGYTDEDGYFSLKTVQTGEDGAVPGQHVVRIRVKPGEYDPVKALQGRDRVVLPDRWHDGSERFTVPEGGTQLANFEHP